MSGTLETKQLTLTVPALQAKDNGLITCHAENIVGPVTDKVKLHVFCKYSLEYVYVQWEFI